MKRSEARKHRDEKEIEFPFTYTKPKSSVQVKIYKTPRDGYDAFTVPGSNLKRRISRQVAVSHSLIRVNVSEKVNNILPSAVKPRGRPSAMMLVMTRWPGISQT